MGIWRRAWRWIWASCSGEGCRSSDGTLDGSHEAVGNRMHFGGAMNILEINDCRELIEHDFNRIHTSRMREVHPDRHTEVD